MAKSSLLLMALLIVSFASLGRSQVDVLGVNITGRVFCTPTGNPGANSQPLVNATVNLVCNGQTLGQTLTNTTGSFIFQPLLDTIAPLITSLPNCMVVVNLPAANPCALLPQTGSLRAPIFFIGYINSIINFVTGRLRLVRV